MPNYNYVIPVHRTMSKPVHRRNYSFTKKLQLLPSYSSSSSSSSAKIIFIKHNTSVAGPAPAWRFNPGTCSWTGACYKKRKRTFSNFFLKTTENNVKRAENDSIENDSELTITMSNQAMHCNKRPKTYQNGQKCQNDQKCSQNYLKIMFTMLKNDTENHVWTTDNDVKIGYNKCPTRLKTMLKQTKMIKPVKIT